MRYPLLAVAFLCSLLPTSLAADMGTSWNKAYNRAFKLLEQNPATNEQEIIAIATELKGLAEKLRVADFIVRSQDPVDALEIYHLLEDAPTPATIKEVERRIRWFAQQKRKKLVEYLTKMLKQGIPSKAATTQAPPIKSTVAAKTPTKPRTSPQSPVSPTVQQTITPALPEEEIIMPAAEPTVPVIQTEVPKKASIARPSTSTRPTHVSEQTVIRKSADQLSKTLKTVAERIVRLPRTTALGRKRSLPPEDQEIVDNLERTLKQSMTAAQLQDAQEALLVITRTVELLEKLERWQVLSDDRFELFMDKVREQARSNQPISHVVNQLQQEITDAIAQATESKKEDKKPMTQEGSGNIVAQTSQRSVQGLVNDLGIVIKELQKKQTDVQNLVRIHPGDTKLARVAPTILELLEAQEVLANYFVHNPDVITAVAQQPSLIQQSMAGQSAHQTEQALIRAGIDPSELQEMNTLMRPIQAASAQALTLVKEDPQGVLATFTHYKLPYLSLVQSVVAKPSSAEIEVMAEPAEQVQSPVHIAPVSTRVSHIEQPSPQVSHEELPSGMQELEWPTVEVAPSIPGHQIIGQQSFIESVPHEPVEYQETEAIPYTPRKRVQELSLAEPSQRSLAEEQQEIAHPTAPTPLPEIRTVPVGQVPSVTQSKASQLPEPALPVVRDDEIQKLKTQIGALKEKIEQLLQEAPPQASEYRKYLGTIIESLEPTKLVGQDKKMLTELRDVQTKAYQHIFAHVNALQKTDEWQLRDFNQAKAYDIVATKLVGIQDISPTTDQYKKDFLPQAITTLIDEIYYKPKGEEIKMRIDALTGVIRKAQQDFEKDAAAESYATKLKSLVDQLSYIDIQNKGANKALSSIQRAYDNLMLLAKVAEASVDWNLTKAHAQVYKGLIDASARNAEQLTKEKAEAIVQPLLDDIRIKTIKQLVKSSLSEEQLKTINLDKAIKAGIAIKDLIDDNLIVQTIKQTVQLLKDTSQKRLTDEQLLDKTLQGQASLGQGIDELLREAIDEKITTANREIDALFNAVDDGLRYYLFTLAKGGDSDNDQLAKQQELISLILEDNLNEAINKLGDYSEGRLGRANDLDRIKGALIRDWGGYWNQYGGIRRVMTQQEIKDIVAQAQQAPLMLKIQELREQSSKINATLLSDAEKRKLTSVKQTLAQESISEQDVEIIEKIMEALSRQAEEEAGSESEEESEGEEEEFEP